MLSSKTKRELKVDQRQILIDSIEIGIPSTQQILTWGERMLPNGKKVGLVKNSKTVNYKRFTPFRDGLFCERIFGPVTSFVCACGKKQPHNKVTFCEKCEVEYIDQRSRRYRLGYISLLSPVTHIWYLKGRPSYLSLFLGKRKKTIVALAYCNAYLIEHGISKRDNNLKMSDTLLSMRSRSNTKNFLQDVEKKPSNLASYSCNTFGLKEDRGSYSVKVSSSISRSNKKKGNIKNLISKNQKRFNRKFFATFLTHYIKKKEFSLSTSYGTRFYARQHTLPFLPTLISHFYLRDVLLNFTYSSPDYNDIPLVEYCSTKRREPLQDVHKFMAHKTVEYDLSNFTQFSKKDLCKKELVFKGLRAYKRGLNTSKTGLKTSSFFSTPSFLENGCNNGSDLKKQNYKLKSKSDFLRSTNFLVLKNKPSTSVVLLSKTNRVKVVNLQISALQLLYLYAKGGESFFPRRFLRSRASNFLRSKASKFAVGKPVGKPVEQLGSFASEGSTFTVSQMAVAFFQKASGSFLPKSFGKKVHNSKTPLLRKKAKCSALVEAKLLKFSRIFAFYTFFFPEGFPTGLPTANLEALLLRNLRGKKPSGFTKHSFVKVAFLEKKLRKESWKLSFLQKLPQKGVQKKLSLANRRFARAVGENPIFSSFCIPHRGHFGMQQGRTKRVSKRKTSEASLLRKSAASGVLLRSKAFQLSVDPFRGKKPLDKPTEEHKRSFSDNVPSTIETKSCKGTSLSGLELTAIREILSYTGGGALQQLLQQFDQHDLCKFLFAEAQILRVLYETHLANFSNVLVNENQQDTCVATKKSIIQHSLIVPAYSSFLVQIKKFATFLTPKELTFSSKRLYGKKVSGRAYHLSRNHKSLPAFSKLFRKDFIKSFFLLEKKVGRQVRGQRIVRGNFVSSSELTFVPGIQKSKLLLNAEKNKVDHVNFTKKQGFQVAFPEGGRSETAIQNKKVHCKIRKGTSKTLDLPFTRTSLQDQILGHLVTKRSFVSQIYDKKNCRVLSTPPRANGRFERGNLRCELLTPYTCFATRALPQSGFRVAEKPRSFAPTKKGQLLIPKLFYKKLRPFTGLGEEAFLKKATVRSCASRTTSAKIKRKQFKNNFCAKELRSKKEKKIYLTPDELQNKVNDLRKKQITRISKRIYKIARRLKVTQLLTRNHRRPEWMILSHLPVLPPDLRPILQMSEKVIVASDLNIMYQRVIYRNNRHLRVRFIDFHLVTAIQRLVQDAVDRLIENGKGGSKPYYTQSGRPLKSLSDILKGKKGRFRLNLLGKRVDFSGRSVIVVSPSCKIHECGLPKDIALELYHYFLLRQLIVKKYCASIVTAKKMIKSKSSLMWDILRELMYHHPVLLNRAPTLHRLGIQAFQPKLVFGNAILLHPLVCSGFNADFDGDQMGVHLPLSFAARAESWDLLWSRNNLLSPATGQPMLVPSQDMVLGFYYITAQSLQDFSSNSNPNISKKDLRAPTYPNLLKGVTARQLKTKFDKKSKNLYKKNKRFLFLSTQEITTTFQKGDIKLHTPVWLHWNGKIENEDISQIPLELRVDSFGKQQFVYEKYIYSNFFTKDRNANEDLLSYFSAGFATVPKKESFGASFRSFFSKKRDSLKIYDLHGPEGDRRSLRSKASKFPNEKLLGKETFGERNLEARLLQKSQEETRQLLYNQLYNSFSPTTVYKPFSFICTKPQVYYVRTTAGRILMNNLLDIKKNI